MNKTTRTRSYIPKPRKPIASPLVLRARRRVQLELIDIQDSYQSKACFTSSAVRNLLPSSNNKDENAVREIQATLATKEGEAMELVSRHIEEKDRGEDFANKARDYETDTLSEISRRCDEARELDPTASNSLDEILDLQREIGEALEDLELDLKTLAEEYEAQDNQTSSGGSEDQTQSAGSGDQTQSANNNSYKTMSSDNITPQCDSEHCSYK